MNATVPAVLIFTAWFLLNTLAASRLAVLATDDKITAPARERFTAWADPRAFTRPLATLANCSWCAAVWMCAALAVLDAAAGGPLERGIEAAGYEHVWVGWAVMTAAMCLPAGMLAVKTSKLATGG